LNNNYILSKWLITGTTRTTGQSAFYYYDTQIIHKNVRDGLNDNIISFRLPSYLY